MTLWGRGKWVSGMSFFHTKLGGGQKSKNKALRNIWRPKLINNKARIKSISCQIIDVMDPPPYGTCAKTKVYIADVTGCALIVYDAVTNKSWKIQNKLVEHKSSSRSPLKLIFHFPVLSLSELRNIHNCRRVI